MAFWGRSFVFNDIPCETFDLMIYDIGSDAQRNGEFASTVTVIEENLASKWKPIFYGVKYEKRLEFEFVFGVNSNRIDNEEYLDRYELDAIASWLTGHDKYMVLEIEQDDMAHVRYKCLVSSLSIVEYGNIPWALKAVITCDSPYGYLYPQTFQYKINGSADIQFFNESSHNGYYKPEIELSISGGDFEIINLTDGGRSFKFTNVPAAVSTVTVDNENCIITNSADINLYPYFNFKFFRLKKGYNNLRIIGSGELKIKCEFPINVGG